MSSYYSDQLLFLKQNKGSKFIILLYFFSFLSSFLFNFFELSHLVHSAEFNESLLKLICPWLIVFLSFFDVIHSFLIKVEIDSNDHRQRYLFKCSFFLCLVNSAKFVSPRSILRNQTFYSFFLHNWAYFQNFFFILLCVFLLKTQGGSR